MIRTRTRTEPTRRASVPRERTGCQLPLDPDDPSDLFPSLRTRAVAAPQLFLVDGDIAHRVATRYRRRQVAERAGNDARGVGGAREVLPADNAFSAKYLLDQCGPRRRLLRGSAGRCPGPPPATRARCRRLRSGNFRQRQRWPAYSGTPVAGVGDVRWWTTTLYSIPCHA